jgi:2-haloacid dehalogenase
MAKLTDFEALTFDCYGTLIDWESGMIEALKPVTSKASRPLKRDEILEAHARHESSESFSFSNEKLGVDFDAIYTAEDCGFYKPPCPQFRVHAPQAQDARD